MDNPRKERPLDPAAEEQDAEWSRYVQRLRAGPPIDFAEQWEEFRRIYAGRPPAAPPPQVWCPDAAVSTDSNLASFMSELGIDGYGELHGWSVRERAEFWGRVVRRLGIVFAQPAGEVMGGRDVRRPRWLQGARLNCVDSCFAADPEKTAIVSDGGDGAALRRTSYGELRRLAARVANGLRGLGLGEGDSVALYMPMTVECVAAYLGTVAAGCRVVSIADSFASAEVRRRMEIAGASWVLTVEAFRRGGKLIGLYEKVREAGTGRAIVISAGESRVPRLRRDDIPWARLLESDDVLRTQPGDAHRITNVLFSSGTTADPKAIAWTHLTPIKCAMDGHFHQDVRPDDVVAWPTNIGWMMGPWLIYAVLINRATMALYEDIPSGPGFAHFVQRAGVTVLGTVPSLVRAWRSSGALRDVDWSGVRIFSSTGEPSSREDYLWLMSLTGYRAPVIEYCGGTEIGGGYITGTVLQPASPSTFTTLALGIDAHILGERGEPVAEGQPGEVYLVPPSVGLSETLLNKDHDAVYYAGCPRGPAGEVLRRHGDRMVRLPGGYFRAQGRADDTMNLGGIKVSALELEAVLNSHPDVYESAAIAVQPEGEGADRLVVFAVPADDVEADDLKAELDRLIAARLNPLFRIHDLRVTGELPRTATNKLLRRRLRDLYQEVGRRD